MSQSHMSSCTPAPLLHRTKWQPLKYSLVPNIVAARAFRPALPRPARVSEPLPIRKPVGAMRAGLFGFLLGTTLTAAAVYYYILQEYKVSNEILTGNIQSVGDNILRVHSHVQMLENKCYLRQSSS
ncbi:hypothetical protein BGHDH14_bgh02764 [Blumeria hordei DH14]|uniref:Uncharacterized protein n=1 Tax=Blumeria graminis f. sp. hordei (strain DH14) TaxID=546991 RepID=N1J780_BLUG1|nr:hypothetical protein BGHDH14_bgh02764 [Blumeria hordei DH14]